MKLGLLTVFTIFTTLFVGYATVHSQATSIGGLELTASTNNPIPGQIVTVTARSYSIDINAAKVVWTVNNKVSHSGTGATTLELIAPPLGQRLNLNVVATTPEGRSVMASLVIGSGSIDLIFETDGYIPPLFEGKLSPVHQNSVRIIAIPHLANANGVEYDPKTLVYQWRKDDRAIEDQSGYGKQTLTLAGEIVPRPYTISVTVWPPDNSARAQALIDVSTKNPSIALYVDDPLYGPLFNVALDSLVRIGTQKETTILAVPYGFNTTGEGVGGLEWSWAVNNARRNELSSNTSVVLRAPEGSAGTSNIRLDIRNLDRILQGATARFTASFSAARTTDEDAVFQ